MKTGKEIKIDREKQAQPNSIVSGQFPIVGIGASAGGLEALERFFTNMPVDIGMAFVIIQHLDPTQPGMMPELLQRMTPIKVMQAKNQTQVKPGCVYVIPPNKSLSILNGALHLFDPVEARGLRLPVDIFFRSLADDKQEKSIGVILSGMGSDGSLGIRAIKENNGIVLVQDPIDAKFDGMPRSAIEAVNADIVSPAAELPARLIDYLKFVPLVKPESEIDEKTKSNIDKIIILLREQTGHDFSLYKKSTIFRRIERRKGVHQIDKLQDYVRLLQENPKEVEILFKELLIGVTNFFRDTKVWEVLKEKTLPALIKEKPDGYIFRAWITGCSTGEEAYSLAIIFKEILEADTSKRNITLQIFATDLDSDAIEKARKGVFPANISNDVSPERLSRFFTPEGDYYRINSSLRELVVFAPQNVIKDPPFTKLDILSCRNMLIYMEPELQNKLIALFNYSLNPGGVMLLGSAETPGNMKEAFIDLEPKLKIYKRSATNVSQGPMNLPSTFYHPKAMASTKIPVKTVENIQTIADQIILQRFAPASVLVNNKGDIVYITGRTGKYLEPVAGKANWNIYAMAREGLSQELPGAFRKIMQTYDPLTLPHVKIGTNGGTQYVDVTLQRLEAPDSVKDMIIIVFNDVTHIVTNKEDLISPKKLKPSAHQKKLELDLKRSHEELQSMREEMQTSQEELKSTNEELQSTNEELQSSNEELTTSKEEMQSLNEELQTVNSELQCKVNDYVQANNDMKNLLNSTEIATLFLDKELNIRRFTETVTNLFKLRKTDIGRPFTDLVNDLQYPEIDSHARQVLKTLTSIETSIATNYGKWFSIRIMPYRTIEDRIDGLVITFSDITKSKLLEIELKKANENLLNNKR